MFAPSNITRPVVYLRTSTEEQDLGIEVQRSRCLDYLKYNNVTPVAVLEEQKSAKNVADRPKLREALEMVRHGRADALIVMKLDRLTRSVQDFLTILDDSVARGWNLVVLEERIETSIMGRLLATILAAFAEWERGMISSRTKAAMGKAREQRWFTGGHLPPGTTRSTGEDGITRVVRGPDAEKVERIWPMVASGAPLSTITKYLNEHQLGGRSNWNSATAHQLINSKYVVDAGLVTEVDQRAAVAVLGQRKFGGGKQPKRLDLLTYLEGLVTCPTCGSKTTPYPVKDGKYVYFKCHKKNKGGTCDQKDFRSTPIEEAVDRVLLEAMESKEFAAAWKAASEGERAKAETYRQELTEAEADLAIVEAGVRALVEKADPTSPVWKATQAKYDERLLAARRRVQGAREALTALGTTDPEEGALLGAWALAQWDHDPWSSTDLRDRDEMRQWARVVVRRITLDKDGEPIVDLAPLAAYAEAQRRSKIPKNSLTRPFQGGLELPYLAPRGGFEPPTK
jgi:DNA invertase Pin-like site-specific DNA recombinase